MNTNRFDARALKLLVVLATLASFALDSAVTGQQQTTTDNRQPATLPQLDPRAWGSNHVGKPIPEYVQGDECLFCHRNTIGPSWQKDAHGTTVRTREDAPALLKLAESQPSLAAAAKEVEYFLGSRHHVRLLKRAGFGKFAIFDARLSLTEGAWKAVDGEKRVWDREKFANRCAGCHATAVDASTKAFTAFGLECYTCHGDVTLDHTKDISLVLLSKKRRNEARVITSLCAQCHLREGTSRSTGLPYANNFVAGDNLFQDFEVDWRRADDPGMNAGDRHIWRNVRDVAVNGDESITCLSCHQVHNNASLKHRRVLRAPICAECHAPDSFKNPKPYVVRSGLCEY
ncbi:MAG: multiheme c-type cytochrome [Blastocatellia bacterium]|nr:multiheme c-type cytochrome [Blastocatellia bacterium]